jgi:mycothiol S-conjugate amidase
VSAVMNDPADPAAADPGRKPAPLRLMAVHAHPDDESSKGAASMARYVREGVEVLVATLTGGERGDILNKAMERPEVRANLPRIRREEMARAREILGVDQHFLGFVDSGLPEGDPLPPLPDGCFALQPLEVAAEPLVRAVREFRPHVLLTYDEGGGYPHPDHIKTHEVAVEAFEAAADPDRYRGSGEPWQPLKLYYFATFHADRFTALHEEMLRRGLESPYTEWFERWDERSADRKPLEITTRVPCGEYFPVRDQALLAHATQIDPESSWFACPVEVQRAAWPTEDYHLARSVVDTDFPEDDLFAGIRERVSL